MLPDSPIAGTEGSEEAAEEEQGPGEARFSQFNGTNEGTEKTGEFRFRGRVSKTRRTRG